MKKEDSNYRFAQTLACLLLLFPIFNPHLVTGSTPKMAIGYISSTFGIIGLLLFCKKRKFTKKTIRVWLIILAILIATLVNNAFLKNGLRIGMFISQYYYFIALIPLMVVKIPSKQFLKVLNIFFIEHIFFTAFAIIVPSVYADKILPILCDNASYCFARQQFLNDNNPGFTTHYSTNGIILSFATIYYFLRAYKSKSKKEIIILLISTALLLSIGKRALPVFVALSITIYYFTTKRTQTNATLKKITTALLIALIALSLYVITESIFPQISRTINRIQLYSNSDDISNGRSQLYELALSNWKESPVVGKGWGSFSISAHKYKNRYKTDYVEAHNDYIQMLSELGVIGLLLYIAILIKIIITLRNNTEIKDSRYDEILYSFSYTSAILFVVYGLTGHPLHTTLTYALMLILISQNINSERTQKIK